ncbi:unnamed protein product [Cladocopium goreaui]|uniref:Uncharacterized protein n=1 Tax=Cladocopium goreaui TaxID=2562237 RepID=A0A9P1DGS1_9DINO|nr:unnamed protein product [Cladocopium goreaui]
MLRVADTRCGLLQVIPVPPVQVILGAGPEQELPHFCSSAWAMTCFFDDEDEVQLSAPVLAKLVLYRNAIDSTSCLRQLPSLTQLDLGRNKLTELDDISEWTPLLQKAFLYENRLVRLQAG